MKYNSFHKNFELNALSFSSVKDVLVYSKTISTSVHTFLTDWFSDRDFVVVHTSGSTGTPKPIKIKKEFMINSAKATGAYFSLSENTTALLCLSTDFIAGKMMLVRALLLGWKLDIVTPASNPLNFTTKTYDFSAMVPLQLEKSLDKIHQVQKLIVGGGVVSKNLQLKLQKIPTRIWATYGMTETVTHIAVRKLNHFNLTEKRERNIYALLPNSTVYIDEKGCLVIDAPTISEDLVFTKDSIQLISETQFEWLGRFDSIINSGGIKLHPEAIEKKISTQIKERFFIAGISDALLGQKLVLIIEKEVANISQEKLLNNLKGLSKFETPKRVYYINKFVETETKKINRKKTLDIIFFTNENSLKSDI